jgi:hypothetical protein
MRKVIFALSTAMVMGFTISGVAESPPKFKELFDLLRTNLNGITERDLNAAAVNGLVDQLKPRVTLVEMEGERIGQTNSPASFRASVFENAYGYFRLGEFGSGLESRWRDAYRQMASTNRLKGVVLDLRYADGQDYKVAAALADQFFTKEEPLVDWGEGLQKASSKTNAIELPMAILVNHGTSGAAEALAGILRQAQLGLILGTNTAGNAAIAREFALSTGQRVRVASTPIKFADGKPFPGSGLKPDIYVDVNPEDELAWFDDSFKVLNKPVVRASSGASNELSSVSTNRSPRRRLNEAELVRMLREGLNPETELGSAAREVERSKGLVSDPVLARALDLLKGLTVVQQFRSS